MERLHIRVHRQHRKYMAGTVERKRSEMLTIEEKLDVAPIGKLALRLGIPAMFAQFFSVLYSIVDRIFVGNIPDNGQLALASVGVCSPALAAISAFAFMVGIGGSSLMSIKLGEREEESAQKAINNSLMLLIVISAVVTGIAILLKRPLLFLLGCSEKMYPFANTYFTIYVLGTVVSLVGTGMNQFIMAQGYAKKGMLAVTIGAAANILLDPVFIFGFDMGIAGAALATVISQLLTMIYVLHFLCREDTSVKIRIGGYSGRISGRIISIGVMSFLITLLDNFIIILLNATLRRYAPGDAGDVYIACAAVVQSFMTIVYLPSQGITTGCATIFSYHSGAKHFRKVDKAFTCVLCLCGAYMGLLFLTAQLIPSVISGFFLQEADYIALASSFLRKYTLCMVFVAFQYAYVDGLTAMGKVRYALPMSVFRKIFYIICVIFLPMAMSLEAVFYANAIADFVGGSFTCLFFWTVVRKRIRRELTCTGGADLAEK